MADRKTIPPHVRRSLLVIIIILMGISVARLLVSMHQQEERIEILEAQVSQLLSDTTRLQIQPISRPNTAAQDRNNTYQTYTPRDNRHHTPSKSSDASDNRQSAPAEQSKADSTAHRSQASTSHKFTEVHRFDLNTIDSTMLVRIPGIAARTASTILKNRQRYGGFYSPWQLQEFLTWDAAQAYMQEWCTQWFTADTSRIRQITLNTASVSELQRHPYITHEQAIEIARYRTRHKRISSPKEFQQFSTFDASQIECLLHYLNFE